MTEPIKSETLVRDTATAALHRVLELFIGDHVERVFDVHRLAYRWEDDSVELFVCKCGEGYVRRKFNAHLREKLKEVA